MIEVVRVTDRIADALAAFFRKVWTEGATADDVRLGLADSARRNPVAPGADVPAVVYMRDGEIIGYLGTIPVKYWNGGDEIAAHWLKGLMVLPEYRSGPVGFSLLREMLRHVQLSGSMAVAAPATRLITAVGFTDCGVVPNFVALVRPGRVARSIDIAAIGLGLPPWLDRIARMTQRVGLAWLGGVGLGAGIGAWRAVRSRVRGFDVDVSGSLPDASELDALWARARETIRAGAVRDGRFLTWRYDAARGRMYEAVAVRRRTPGTPLAAVAVVRRPSEKGDPRLRGIKVATLSDVLFSVDDPAAGVAAVRGAERVARRMGADAIVCSVAHPAITTLLRRRAYLRLPGNLHLLLRDPRSAAALPTALDEWWLTRGDASSDEVF